MFFFLMIRRPPRSTQSRSSAASDVYKRQIQEYENLWKSEAGTINSHPIVVNSKQLLKQKVAIAAVLELIFHKKADERLISFEELAEMAVIPVNEVELLLMKAMSLGLIKGRINEVCLLYTSPSPRDRTRSRMPSSA
eukprot:TRINITY_DN6981_c0_g1_i1.p1 TRINITY_DN6981_c0_g1~~TRINITY_DN6981_c0_g1_i1.p1  ORF type:complete len:137 (+),score=85.71 TRINITY_DN6981_c0_g1_i1:51-461(+)